MFTAKNTENFNQSDLKEMNDILSIFMLDFDIRIHNYSEYLKESKNKTLEIFERLRGIQC